MQVLGRIVYGSKRLLLVAVFLLAGAMFMPNPLLAGDNSSPLDDVKITLNLKDIPLKNVAEDIRRQTGYTVVFSESLVSVPVSGMYNEVSLDEFFRRALKGKNISVVTDTAEKLFVVKAFGDKTIVALGDKISPEKLNEMVPGMDLTFEELRQQEEANKLALDEALSNPDTIDPISGLSLGEVRKQEEENKAALDEALNNPETVVPHSGDLTMEQIREANAKNKEELARRMNDSNTVDPVTGMNLGELKRVEAENKRVLDEALKNPDTIDPMTGLTLRELRAQEGK